MLVRQLDQLKAELAQVNAALAAVNLDLATCDPVTAPRLTPATVTATLGSLQQLFCPALLRLLTVNAIVTLMAVSRHCRDRLSSTDMWRGAYSMSFPYELAPTVGEPSHPLDASVWQQLYLERRLNGDLTVPCVLLSPAGMARATIDPGGIRLIEAYLRRLCQQLGKLYGALLSPPEVPALKEAALLECERWPHPTLP